MTVAKVVLEQTAYSYDKPYDYIIPDKFVPTAKRGCRVIVPFGKGDSTRQGIIIDLLNDTDSNLKHITAVLDFEPILNDEMISMAVWMHEHLFCTYFDAIKLTLPVGVSFKVNEVISKGIKGISPEFKELNDYFNENPVTTKENLINRFDFISEKTISLLLKDGQLVKNGSAVRKLNDTTIKFVKPLVPLEELNCKLTDKQFSVYKFIVDSKVISVKDIIYYTGVSLSVLKAIENKSIVEIFDKEVLSPYNSSNYSEQSEDIVLTDEQVSTYNGLCDLYASNKPEVALLYGVTGSGKTSVFLKLVDRVISENKGAIIMVPEIALTPQTIGIFGNRYGDKIAVFHSAMSQTQRMNEWKRVKNGDALIAIGTRSAVLAPVKNLSLIIMDEEQEHTYKSEKSPRFHARDLAKFRAKYNNCLLLLASATPAIESYALAKANKYKLFTLTKRYGNAKLPDVKIVDMNSELAEGNKCSLSSVLLNEINTAINQSHQAIILLNRRGYNTYVSCPSCHYVATCPNCSVSMTYHSANGRMMCHYCGHSQPVDKICPSCNNGRLRFVGMGTQKIEEELKIAFPDSKILRLDADSTSNRGSFAEYLEKFSAGEYDIMLGTQMVAKGLNFPNVTVVGVLGADSTMNSIDYRSFERSFSLLTQVLGRAGRGESAGTAIIQTNDPSSNLIRLAANQDYDAFYNDEILTRKITVYPPYCDIVSVYVQSESQLNSLNTSNEVFKNIKNLIEGKYNDIKLIILGPSVTTMPKVNNKYRYRLIIKVNNSKRFRDMLREAIDIKLDKSTNIIVDINPETIL